MAMRCLIVDDSAYFLEAARSLLEHGGMTVAGVASNGSEALQRCDELRPDVTLVDIDLGQENGFDVAEQLTEQTAPSHSPVILISAHSEVDFADLVEASPAVGFLSK